MPAKLLLDWVASGQQVTTSWRKCPTFATGFLTQDKSRAIKSEVQRLALAHSQHLPIIWNIEHWPMPAAQDRLIEVIEWAREVRPDVRQSIYMMAPHRSYWAPVEYYLDKNNATYRRRYEQWLALNETLGKLAAAMDFITPSIYTFYRDGDGTIGRHDEFWFEYAAANLAEAAKYGKQVIPFMSPRYWAPRGFPPMEVSLFQSQMEFALQRSDGVFMFDWVGNSPSLDLSGMMRAVAESSAV